MYYLSVVDVEAVLGFTRFSTFSVFKSSVASLLEDKNPVYLQLLIMEFIFFSLYSCFFFFGVTFSVNRIAVIHSDTYTSYLKQQGWDVEFGCIGQRRENCLDRKKRR